MVVAARSLGAGCWLRFPSPPENRIRVGVVGMFLGGARGQSLFGARDREGCTVLYRGRGGRLICVRLRERPRVGGRQTRMDRGAHEILGFC